MALGGSSLRDEQADRLIEAVVRHGNQLGNNLVHMKRFTKKQSEDQETFLAELQSQNSDLQKQAVRATQLAAGAAIVSAFVTAVQVGLAILR